MPKLQNVVYWPTAAYIHCTKLCHYHGMCKLCFVSYSNDNQQKQISAKSLNSCSLCIARDIGWGKQWGVPGAPPEHVLFPPQERTLHLIPRRTTWPHLPVIPAQRERDRCGHTLQGLIHYTQSFLSTLLMKVGVL